MEKTVYRSSHRKNYTVIGNQLIAKPDLSWKAKGVLIYLLSKPEDWITRLGDIVKHSTDGRASVLSGLKELKQKGYLEKVRVTDPRTGRVSHWETIVHEEPVTTSPDVENPHSGNPHSGNPHSGKSNGTKYGDKQSTNQTHYLHQSTNQETANAGLDAGESENDSFSLFDHEQPEDNCTSPEPDKDPGFDQNADTNGHIQSEQKDKNPAESSKKSNKHRLSDSYTPRQWGNAMAVAKRVITNFGSSLGLRLSENLIAACVGVDSDDACRIASEVCNAGWDVHNPTGLLISRLKETKVEQAGIHRSNLVKAVPDALEMLKQDGILQYRIESEEEYLYAFKGDTEWTREKMWILPRGYFWRDEETAA